MEEIVTPTEAKLDELLQLLALLINRLGGEIVIGRHEFTEFDGVKVVGRNLTSGYVLFRLDEEDEEIGVCDLHQHDPNA